MDALFVTNFSLSNRNPESVISELDSIRQQMRVSTDINLAGHMNELSLDCVNFHSGVNCLLNTHVRRMRFKP